MYCKFRIFREGFIFAENKTWQICLIMLFPKNIILAKILNLQYLTCLVEYASVNNIDSDDPVSDEAG